MPDALRRSSRALPALALVAIAVLVPYAAGTSASRLSQYYFIVAMVMMALGLNIVMGYAGQLFLGPTALFSAGGYAAAYLAQEHAWLQGLPAMCVVSVITGLVIAAALALPTARISGLYYGLLTLYIAIAVPEMASRINALGGTSGIDLIADPDFVQNPTGMTLYFIGIAMVIALCCLSWGINRSRLGRRFSAIRHGDELASALGVAPASTKLVAFLIGSVPCALAGALLRLQPAIHHAIVCLAHSFDLHHRRRDHRRRRDDQRADHRHVADPRIPAIGERARDLCRDRVGRSADRGRHRSARGLGRSPPAGGDRDGLGQVHGAQSPSTHHRTRSRCGRLARDRHDADCSGIR